MLPLLTLGNLLEIMPNPQSFHLCGCDTQRVNDGVVLLPITMICINGADDGINGIFVQWFNKAAVYGQNHLASYLSWVDAQ